VKVLCVVIDYEGWHRRNSRYPMSMSVSAQLVEGSYCFEPAFQHRSCFVCGISYKRYRKFEKRKYNYCFRFFKTAACSLANELSTFSHSLSLCHEHIEILSLLVVAKERRSRVT